jgi:hypothetical protein
MFGVSANVPIYVQNLEFFLILLGIRTCILTFMIIPLGHKIRSWLSAVENLVLRRCSLRLTYFRAVGPSYEPVIGDFHI